MKIKPKCPPTSIDVIKIPSAPAPVPIPHPNIPDSSKKDAVAKLAQVEKQAKQITQGHLAEQKIGTQQIKSQLSEIADGKLPTAAAFLNSPPPKSIQNLPRKIQKELSSIGKSLDPMNPEAAREKFGSLVSKMPKSPTTDVKALVQFVLREAYLQIREDLRFYAEKIKFFNNLKNSIRDEIKASRQHLSQGKSDQLQDQLSSVNQMIKDMEAQQEDLRNKRQIAIQHFAYIAHHLKTTAMSIIGKTG